MRLIDADALIKYLGFENTQEERDDNVGEIITLEDIDNQPTVYDVDKVVEELELNSFEFGTDTLPAHYVRLNDAIESLQKELEREMANRRMYATDIVIDLQKQLDEYKTLEEQGLLLQLPCKVGDTVYVKMASYCDIQYAEAEVRDFTHFTSCGFCVVVTSKHFDKQNIPFSEFGKTVFLTQAEAEQKLKEMESE